MIRILHFSDIHFGQEVRGDWEPHDDVRREVVSDVRRMLSEKIVDGVADVILVSGDIAQKGLEAEFKKAASWLDLIKDAACSSKVVVRTVPGNHDVNLSVLGLQGEILQKAIREMGNVEERYQSLGSLAATGSQVFTKLDDYRSFASAHGSDFKSHAAPYYESVFELPGGRSIRLCGLCSVMLSDRSDREGNMILGLNQYAIPRERNYIDIFMMHHPITWYSDRARAENYLNSRPKVIITGHEHSFRLSKVEREQDHEQLLIAAGALNPPHASSSYNYSYNWIEITRVDDGSQNEVIEVRVYPRAWNESTTSFTSHQGITGLSKSFRLNCGRKIAVDPPLDVQAEVAERTPTAIKIEESPMDQDPNFERLTMLFWKRLSKERRTDVLIRLGFLTEHARSRVPSSFERMALDTAREKGKLFEIWEALMEELPASDREANPFLAGDQK